MLLFFVYEQSQFYNILMILIKFIYDKSSNIFLIYQDIVCGDLHPNILSFVVILTQIYLYA